MNIVDNSFHINETLDQLYNMNLACTYLPMLYSI